MAAPKRPARIKNYTTILEVEESIAIIREALKGHKARRISFDYDDDGEASALQFTLKINGRSLHFRLPVRLDVVEAKVLEANEGVIITERIAEQAHRTAWANIKDWVLAQCALIDSNMVKLEEVFLPYLVDQAGKTYFEAFEERLALPSPSDESVGSYVIVEEQ